jgi:hypothetical protein
MQTLDVDEIMLSGATRRAAERVSDSLVLRLIPNAIRPTLTGDLGVLVWSKRTRRPREIAACPYRFNFFGAAGEQRSPKHVQ